MFPSLFVLGTFLQVSSFERGYLTAMAYLMLVAVAKLFAGLPFLFYFFIFSLCFIPVAVRAY